MPEALALACWLIIGALIYLRASKGAGVLFCPRIRVDLGKRFIEENRHAH